MTSPAATAEVVAAHGIDVWLFDRPAPTPVGCYAVVEKEAGGAVMITASHNPGIYNGFKYKTDVGGSAPPEVVEPIEAGLDEAQAAAGRATREQRHRGQGLREPAGAASRPLTRCRRTTRTSRTLVDLAALRDAGLTVVYDAMHSTGAGILAAAARRRRARTARHRELRGERNPAFPGMTSPEPITRNLTQLAETRRRRRRARRPGD